MANIVPYSFPVELLKGNHDFVNDTYTISLYTSIAAYSTASKKCLDLHNGYGLSNTPDVHHCKF